MGERLFRALRRLARRLLGWGKFIFIFGPMYSGKTLKLVGIFKSLKRRFGNGVIIFMPALDTRRAPHEIVSFDGDGAPATQVDDPLEILKRLPRGVEVVILDETHFWQQRITLGGRETWAILYVVEQLLKRGINVCAAGLNTDFFARPFDPVPDLMRFADWSVGLRARCDLCGGEAAFSVRLVAGKVVTDPDAPQIVVAGKEGEEGSGGEVYEARCGKCHPCVR